MVTNARGDWKQIDNEEQDNEKPHLGTGSRVRRIRMDEDHKDVEQLDLDPVEKGPKEQKDQRRKEQKALGHNDMKGYEGLCTLTRTRGKRATRAGGADSSRQTKEDQ
ncbi:hypothetical protein NDU88_004468 [Pleurodeles waltl]|uniref:Uncharacterized protein n=1 Tax=Pleurodeles waltl TaxID=8319 RepID=A0AAV7NNM9_PLEWA|nr:hypothetical protein NDU88_004468 [Pleurodeles waltl]